MSTCLQLDSCYGAFIADKADQLAQQTANSNVDLLSMGTALRCSCEQFIDRALTHLLLTMWTIIVCDCNEQVKRTLKLYGRMKRLAMPSPITLMIHSSKFLGLPETVVFLTLASTSPVRQLICNIMVNECQSQSKTGGHLC